MSERQMKTSEIRDYSPLTWGLERAFFLLQYTSPANLFFGTRVASQSRMVDDAATRAETKRRSRRIDAYVVSWLILETLGVAIGASLTAPCAAFAFVALYRVLELVQSAINMSLFDRLRGRLAYDRVATLTRTLILSLVNFFEAIVCFGIAYSSIPDVLKGVEHWFDPYYFSTVTQLTIGYGDIHPQGVGRILVTAQALTGFILGLLAVSRFVALLPNYDTVAGDGGRGAGR